MFNNDGIHVSFLEFDKVCLDAAEGFCPNGCGRLEYSNNPELFEYEREERPSYYGKMGFCFGCNRGWVEIYNENKEYKATIEPQVDHPTLANEFKKIFKEHNK